LQGSAEADAGTSTASERMAANPGLGMLCTTDGETGIDMTLSPESPRMVRPALGRIRLLPWKSGLKIFSLNFFFQEKMLVTNVHFFCSEVGVNEVLSEPESSIVKTEEFVRVIFTMEVSGIEPGYDPFLLLGVLHYGRSVSFR